VFSVDTQYVKEMCGSHFFFGPDSFSITPLRINNMDINKQMVSNVPKGLTTAESRGVLTVIRVRATGQIVIASKSKKEQAVITFLSLK